MLHLPPDLAQQFSVLLEGNRLSGPNKAAYLKWLRFYWDFCHKYRHNPHLMESLPPFLDKLQEKGQSEQQRNQAQQAIKWFYCLRYGKAVSTGNAASTQTIGVSRENQVLTIPAPGNAIRENHINYAAKQQRPERHAGKTTPDCSSKIAEEAHVSTGCSWVFVFDTLHSEIKIRHYSPKTLKANRGWARHFQAFTKSKDYRALTQRDVVEFLSYLAVEKKVSASSQNQAFNALLFLYQHVLKMEFGEIKGVVRAKRRPYIPVVLSREEVELIFDHLSEPVDLVAKLLYGCGLRLFECLNLRVHCFNFDAGVLTVHDGKGKKDRTVPIPHILVPELKRQLQKVTAVFEDDKQANFAGTFLPDQLDRKYKNAAKEFVWQWFFPAQSLDAGVGDQRVPPLSHSRIGGAKSD